MEPVSSYFDGCVIPDPDPTAEVFGWSSKLDGQLDGVGSNSNSEQTYP